ncbi:zinc finger protein 675-like [Sabethes cyaneus]|uniref:zinc finger protein 675-like n=1 Tax=Sabethes cyaneus TaxID=53552 RepID=UPI00237EA249|nr:zinc finger protein 675-like [Sabethes cyaneus]
MSTSEKSWLKAVKKEVRVKLSEIRQCRLCLRIVPKEAARCTRSNGDIRRKIFDAVQVKITAYDQSSVVCVNCVRLVDIIYNFRMACHKSNTIFTNKPLMMDVGSWNSEENQESLENCQEMVQLHRREIDGLYDYSKLAEDEVDLPPAKVVKTEEQNLIFQLEDSSDLKASEIIDSDPEMTKAVAEQLDAPIERKNKNGSIPSRKYICEICGELVDKSQKEYHQNRHAGIKDYHCSEQNCSMAFYSEGALIQHEKKTHVKSRYTCDVCQKKIKTLYHFRKHLLIHENAEPYKLPCPICGKKISRSYLKDHQAVHTGALNYACEKCGKLFGAKTNYTTHVKRCRDL